MEDIHRHIMGGISIHAARREPRRGRPSRPRRSGHFNPRGSQGAATTRQNLWSNEWEFQSTRLAGSRDIQAMGRVVARKISIHAARREPRRHRQAVPGGLLRFQSTRLAGSRDPRRTTRSPGWETFQSTRLAGSRDHKLRHLPRHAQHFNPRGSQGAATTLRHQLEQRDTNFNPRGSQGAATVVRRRARAGARISIHAARREPRHARQPLHRRGGHFNPRGSQGAATPIP